jgi:hypothetical protein
LRRIKEEDLEEHGVVEESITSACCEEEEVHHMVEDSFESLSEDRLRGWPAAKNKGMKATTCPWFPVSRLSAIHEIWMIVATRRKAT